MMSEFTAVAYPEVLPGVVVVFKDGAQYTRVPCHPGREGTVANGLNELYNGNQPGPARRDVAPMDEPLAPATTTTVKEHRIKVAYQALMIGRTPWLDPEDANEMAGDVVAALFQPSEIDNMDVVVASEVYLRDLLARAAKAPTVRRTRSREAGVGEE